MASAQLESGSSFPCSDDGEQDLVPTQPVDDPDPASGSISSSQFSWDTVPIPVYTKPDPNPAPAVESEAAPDPAPDPASAPESEAAPESDEEPLVGTQPNNDFDHPPFTGDLAITFSQPWLAPQSDEETHRTMSLLREAITPPADIADWSIDERDEVCQTYDHQKLQYIARGGCSVVYSTTKLDSEVEVAIKRIRFPEHLHDSYFVEGSESRWHSSYSEVNILTTLKGFRGVCQMVDHFESATTLDLVFELISGDDLYARVLVRKFDENSVKHIARQICDTMARLHGKNIVHRDLKPQNILLGDNLTVIIIDFGCSKSGVTSVTRMTSLLGTLGCIAPEVEKARIYYRNADVYSFAMCLLCLMLSGRPVEIKGVLAIRPPVTLKELDPYIEKCASLDAQDLLYKTLAPAESRISFKEALDHPFFSSSETELAAPSNLGRVIERTSSLTLREDEKGSHRLQCKGPATVRSNSQRSVGEVERENQKGCQRPEKTKPVFQSNSKRSFDEVEEDTKSTAVADRKRSRLRMEDSAQAVHDEAS